MLASAALHVGTASAQAVDSARAGITRATQARADSLRSPGVSARRAFVGSLLLPGSMQLRFDRPKAATIFLLAEAATVGMSAKSWNDLRKAKAARADTVGTPVLDSEGRPVINPDTGQPRIDYVPRNPNLAGRVRARRAHLEDWLAVVVFNHLFSGADAYVAANLVDFDANVGASEDRRVTIVARRFW